MRYIIIKYEDDYADEFDVKGFSVISFESEEEYNKYFSYLERIRTEITDEISLYFGSNEGIDYKNGKDFLKTISIEEITEEQYNTFKQLRLISYGYDIGDYINELEYFLKKKP